MQESDFYNIIEQFHDPVKRFITISVKDPWVADDLTQETFIKAQRKIGTLLDRSKMKGWLMRIAHNTCLDFYRSNSAIQLESFDQNEIFLAAQPLSIVKEIERDEMSDCVQAKLLMLQPNYRSILWLADAGGFNRHEIAAILGIKVNNVKVRLHRARKKFKQILEEHCNFGTDERAVFICSPKLR